MLTKGILFVLQSDPRMFIYGTVFHLFYLNLTSLFHFPLLQVSLVVLAFVKRLH